MVARLVLRRVVHSLVVMVVVVAVVFVVTRVIGDPARIIVGADATASQYNAVRHQLGLDRALTNQFITYAGQLGHLNFGYSVWQQQPAQDVIRITLPETLLLASVAMLLSLAVALPLGIVAAVKQRSLADRIVTTFSLIGLSLPLPWIGLMLMLLFAVTLGWLPTSGQGGIDHIVLPAVTLAIPTAGRLAVIVRTSMIEALGRPWMRSARAQGLPSVPMVGVLALRNAGVSIITFAGWEFVLMLAGGVVIVEYVFGWNGLGFTLLLAIQRQDIVLVQAIVLVIAGVVVVANLLIDLAYMWVDPRIRVS